MSLAKLLMVVSVALYVTLTQGLSQQEISADCNGLQKQIQCLSEEIENLKVENQQLKEHIVELENTIEKAVNDANSEIEALKVEVADLKVNTQFISKLEDFNTTIIDAGPNFLAIQQDGNVALYKKDDDTPNDKDIHICNFLDHNC